MVKKTEDNSKKAVIRLSGKQYLVTEGEQLLVDKLGKDEKIEVLAVISNGEMEVGKPVLEKTKVSYKILEEKVLGDKIRVFKFKAKSRYQKTRGFRAQQSRIEIEKIS